MVGYNYFRNSTHSNCITANDFEVFILSRCFESWSLSAHIHAFHYPDVVAFGNGFCFSDEFTVVGFAHIGEAYAELLVIFSVQRMLGKEIDVVGNYHQITDFKIGIHASGGIRNHQILDTQRFHHTHRKGNLFHVVSFIEMETSLHGKHIHITEFSENEFSAVSFYC